MQLTLQNHVITFEVQYMKRKKMYLDISAEGHITLKVPTNSTEEEIHDYMTSQSETLMNLIKRLENRRYITNQKNYSEEELFLYLGNGYPLGDLLKEIPDTEEEIQRLLKKFYTSQTREIIKKRVKHFEKIIGVKSKLITIVDSPKTWGTCSSNKDLTFNYKLSMAPMSVIDYVVIHELCHILHLNHDRSFWRKVGMYDPNYKRHQEYLEKFGGVMTI